jgi:hypothetical protein
MGFGADNKDFGGSRRSGSERPDEGSRAKQFTRSHAKMAGAMRSKKMAKVDSSVEFHAMR